MNINKKYMAEQITISPGAKLEEFIMDYVHNHGFPNHKAGGYDPIIIVRTFSRDHIGKVLGSGTDRDFSSQMHWPQDREALQREGLNPGDVIYATVPALLSERLDDNSALAAYDSEKLEIVHHTGGPLYRTKNGRYL